MENAYVPALLNVNQFCGPPHYRSAENVVSIHTQNEERTKDEIHNPAPSIGRLTRLSANKTPTAFARVAFSMIAGIIMGR
jgi:hypothetical protein